VLLLPGYIGVYARDKARFVPPPESTSDPAWYCLGWFYSAWARGWQSRVDPRFCLMTADEFAANENDSTYAEYVARPPLLFPRRTFGERVRFYRNESIFLRRHNLPRHFFRSLRQSGMAFLFAWLSRKLFIRPVRGEVRTAYEIFAMLQQDAMLQGTAAPQDNAKVQEVRDDEGCGGQGGDTVREEIE